MPTKRKRTTFNLELLENIDDISFGKVFKSSNDDVSALVVNLRSEVNS